MVLLPLAASADRGASGCPLVTTASSVVQILPGEGRRQRLRPLRRHRSDGRGQPVEEGVLPGRGGPREAPGAAVPVEAQRRLFPPLRNPAASQDRGAELTGAGHGHGRYAPADPASSGLTGPRGGATAGRYPPVAGSLLCSETAACERSGANKSFSEALLCCGGPLKAPRTPEAPRGSSPRRCAARPVTSCRPLTLAYGRCFCTKAKQKLPEPHLVGCLRFYSIPGIL